MVYTIVAWDKIGSQVKVQDTNGVTTSFAVPIANQADQASFLNYVQQQCLAIDYGNTFPATANPAAAALAVVGTQVQGQ
jgi:hypothetical protein